MKTVLSLFALLLCTTLFAQDTIIVNDPADKRLASYHDSAACYQFGLYQVELAKQITDPEDTVQGRISMIQLEAKRISLGLSDRFILRDFDQPKLRGPKINPIRYGIQRIKYKSTFGADYYWGPAIYVKPRNVVVYSENEIKTK